MKNKRRAIWAGIVSALLIIGALTGCTQANASSTTKSQYTDYTVASGEIKNTLSLEGYLTPAKTVTITTDQSSKVAKIIKKKGSTVAKGADILQLENGNMVSAPAKGKITKLNVAVGDWVDSTVTIGTMYDYNAATTTSSGMGSTTTYESVNITSDTTSHIAKVDVKDGDTVAAGDKIAELENGNSIIAPIAGTVSEVNVEAGDKVQAQTQVATIVDTSDFYIYVSVNEIDAQQLKVGQSVDMTINALNLNTTGKVSDISVEGTVSNSTTNFTVKISLDEQNASFRTNMSAQVDIAVADAADALSVPIDAVQTVNGMKVVMVKKDTAYTATEVETGISNASYIQITSGLSEGDIVGVANSTSNFGGPGGMQGGFGDMMNGGSQQQGQPPQGAPPAGGN